MSRAKPLYHRRRFPAEIISHCVWLYFRFCLSYRDVEEIMAEARGCRDLRNHSRLVTEVWRDLRQAAAIPRRRALEIAGISMKSTSRSMASCSICGAPSIRTARCSISWCNRAATDGCQEVLSQAAASDCSTFLGPSSPTNSAVMPPPRRRYCPMCGTYKTSERTIAPRIPTSRRGSENVACEASSRPGTPSGFSRPSGLSPRSFVQVAICWQPGTTGKSCADASQMGEVIHPEFVA